MLDAGSHSDLLERLQNLQPPAHNLQPQVHGISPPNYVFCTAASGVCRTGHREQRLSRYTIDRFEGGDSVVLEDDRARTFRIPRRWLPADAREGDVVAGIEQDGETGVRILRFELDQSAREERQAEAHRLRENLPRAPKGDVSL
jgi:DUF3006 family protein